MDPVLESLHPTGRFTNRVDNYVKYRPSYPAEIISFFENTLGLYKEARIADIGSGTGLFSEPLLKRGYQVTCIEPNDEMRRAGEKRLCQYPGFVSRNHRAEQTGLRSHTVDLITVAQAFHWMDPQTARKEFQRILKPEGYIVLAWNVRLKNSAFLRQYDELKVQFGIDYKAVNRADEDTITTFFEPRKTCREIFPNIQLLDFEALKGQLLSMSYIPLPGHPAYDDMINQLVNIFVQHNDNGLVKMEYETRLYWNQQ